MKITFNHKLFTVDPDARFARIKRVPLGILNRLYNRWFEGEYTYQELQELYVAKTKKSKIDRKNLGVWLRRMEVYKRANHAIEMAGHNWKKLEVDPYQYFGEHAQYVIDELQKRCNQ